MLFSDHRNLEITHYLWLFCDIWCDVKNLMLCWKSQAVAGSTASNRMSSFMHCNDLRAKAPMMLVLSKDINDERFTWNLRGVKLMMVSNIPWNIFLSWGAIIFIVQLIRLFCKWIAVFWRRKFHVRINKKILMSFHCFTKTKHPEKMGSGCGSPFGREEKAPWTSWMFNCGGFTDAPQTRN